MCLNYHWIHKHKAIKILVNIKQLIRAHWNWKKKINMNPINTLCQSILYEILCFKHEACATVDGNGSMKAARLKRKESGVFFPLTLFCADCWSGVWIRGRQPVTGSVNWQRELRDISLPIMCTDLEEKPRGCSHNTAIPLNTTTQKSILFVCLLKIGHIYAHIKFIEILQHKYFY